MDNKTMPVVFTPDNEPYIGRPLLHAFDQIIISAMEENAATAPQSHGSTLTDQQRMACQVIPQALSIMLSIRELIRQGYLFGAHVLARPFKERVAILLYLHLQPEEIEKWNRGWHAGDAPGLATMLDVIQKRWQFEPSIPGGRLTAPMNSLLHAKPDSAGWNLVSIGEGKLGHAASKILDRPALCDELCGEMIPFGFMLTAMMAAYFAHESTA